jgi:hypothetical protein
MDKATIGFVVKEAYQYLMPYGGFDVTVTTADNSIDVIVQGNLPDFKFRETFSIYPLDGKILSNIPNNPGSWIKKEELLGTLENIAKKLGIHQLGAYPILQEDCVLFRDQGYSKQFPGWQVTLWQKNV